MLASVVGVNNTLEIPHEIIRINTQLIINTLEWIRFSKVKKVLFTSTSENYAGTIDTFGYKIPTPEEIPLTITDISHPRFTYAITKMLGESGFLNYSKKLNFECCIVRYHNVFGPRMGFKHVIPHLAERFLSKESPFWYTVMIKHALFVSLMMQLRELLLQWNQIIQMEKFIILELKQKFLLGNLLKKRENFLNMMVFLKMPRLIQVQLKEDALT